MNKISIDINLIENKYYREILEKLADEMGILNNNIILATEEEMNLLQHNSTMKLQEIQKSYTNFSNLIKKEIRDSEYKSYETVEEDYEEETENKNNDKKYYIKGYSDCKLETRGQSCKEAGFLVEDENNKQYTITIKRNSDNKIVGENVENGNKLRISDEQVHCVTGINFFFQYFLPKNCQSLSISEMENVKKEDYISVSPQIFKKGISLDKNSLDLLLLKNEELGKAVSNIDIETTDRLTKEINEL